METISDKKLDQLTSSVGEEAIDPAHRKWMNGQITETLKKKSAGELNYLSLEEARKKIGLDAS